MECKLEIVKELDRLYGGQLIERTDLEQRPRLKKLYGELCAYVHSSYKELRSLQSRSPKELETLRFEQDSEMEAICQDFVNHTMDTVFFVALSLFPEILAPREKFMKMRTGLHQSLEKLGLELTLSKWPHSRARQ
jgi:hypothetical protein